MRSLFVVDPNARSHGPFGFSATVLLFLVHLLSFNTAVQATTNMLSKALPPRPGLIVTPAPFSHAVCCLRDDRLPSFPQSFTVALPSGTVVKFVLRKDKVKGRLLCCLCHTERLAAAAKYRKELGGSAPRHRAVRMFLRTIGQSLLLAENSQFLNPDACYGTKSSRLEKKLAHSSAERFHRWSRYST